ncbi:MAG: hypothetical protein LBF44_00430 [Holosporaceae bacterium]|nr:hypothetical protein [Holosporaceae bacterium]
MNKKVVENKKEKSFPWRIIAIVLFFLASLGIFYRCSKMMLKRTVDLSNCRINKIIGGMEGEIDSLKNDIFHLNKQIASIPKVKNVEVSSPDHRNQLRQKWKAWMALRHKMESNETFEEELKTFHELFACDKELIDLVDNLAQGVEVVTNGNENKILGTCKNILRKIIKLKKINQRKLVEISGYVLSSIDNCIKEK